LLWYLCSRSPFFIRIVIGEGFKDEGFKDEGFKDEGFKDEGFKDAGY